MLESIRKHSKFVMILLFLLIIPSFIFLGVDQSYLSVASPTVARVDGQDITQNDWDNTHRYESDRLRSENPGMDAKLLDSDQARYATLERMVRDLVFQTAAQKMNLITGDAALARALQSIPAVASLRKPDGSLDADGYRALLAAQGMTPESFEAALRRDMSLSQVVGNVMSTELATQAVADIAMNAFLQRREIQVAQFLAKDYAEQVVVSEDALKQFYSANLPLFQQAEQATVQYVLLDIQTVRDGIELNEADVQTYYKENAARFADGKEERRARHILLNASADMSADAREAAKAKAQTLAQELQQDPARFEAVAKAESQDVGSAPEGGDLGYFSRGAMVPEFEAAAFALKNGEVSGVVESEFGYHIIQVTDIKEPQIPAFEVVRERIVNDLKDQQAQRKFAEVADQFANMVFEQSESLQPVMDALGLTAQVVQGVTRDLQPDAQGPLLNQDFLEALFTADALEHQRNTDAIDLGSNQIAAGRVLNYQPAKQLGFAEVADRVKQLYVAQQSAVLAREAGEAALKAWGADPATAKGLSPVMAVSREDGAGQAWPVIRTALQAKTDVLPSWTGVSLGGEGYAVVKVEKVLPPEQRNEEVARQALQQYVQLFSTAEGDAYYDLLKKKFDVQIRVPRP